MKLVASNLNRVTVSFDEEMASTPAEAAFYREHPAKVLPLTDTIGIETHALKPGEKKMTREEIDALIERMGKEETE